MAVAFDIDGVLCRHTTAQGYDAVPGAAAALALLRSRRIPHVFLSNSTGHTEAEKARVLAGVLHSPCEPAQMILATTPFRRVAAELGPRQCVLSVAMTEDNACRLAASYGFREYITLQEYVRRLPHLNPVQHYDPPLDPGATAPAIDCICIFQQPADWGEALQILVDILRSGDGLVGREHENPHTVQHVPLFVSNPDFVYGGIHSLPRFTNGAFVECLEMLYRRVTGKHLAHTALGKPSLELFSYAADALQTQRLALSVGGIAPPPPLSRRQLFMVGDNPLSDIKGANAAGWTSILVRTGCFHGPGNDPEHPAAHVVDNVLDAVNLILQLLGNAAEEY